jgi:isoleucyl-tRNA synthetase
MAEQENQKKSFKDTLNLPQTDFPIRANYKEDDAVLLERWNNENLYHRAFVANKDQEKFILHDGPPYANGHTHIGHAYNKILKDIVCKSQRMLGKNVPVTPGWDCHGLPIEFAVKKENPTLTGAELKKACREYANKWISIQKAEFKKLGVLMDWDNPYLTMNFEYEADILRAFGILVESGYIERKNKTVPWCPTCETVLASAEIEYQDRKDPSIYVLFTLNNITREQLFPQLHNKPVSLLVWTTTPWTLPLNRAVMLKPNTEYAVLETTEQYIIIGKSLVNKIAATLSLENSSIVAEFNSNQIVACSGKVAHPLIDNFEVPVLVDDSVLTDDGTACVHSAPGAGPIDYEVGIKNNLEIYSPITSAGRYTADIKPSELNGMSVADGQGWVITKLLEKNKLLFKTSIKHSYPHCWRCRGGLIFRATKQWFCDLSKNDLKENALESVKKITMLPAASHNRFEATIEGRLEWCLSRQREWGVPITALICRNCDYTYITKEFINEIATHVAQEGIEYWGNVSLDMLLPDNMSCPQCAGVGFEKETDILDVWFDSGVSHFAVLQKNPALAYPANMYLEGKDQHRGWFQSSLLTSMIIEQTPCTKTIVTHGFTVDQHGRKMSKSLGNVVSPQEMVEKLGTDGLRLWASSIDNAGDAVVSEVLLKNVQEVLRKIRNTCRFLLSNINDFDVARDAVLIENMKMIDKYALQELFEIYEEIVHAYEEYNFTKVFHLLGHYCSVNLSSFYLDIIKDRLYVEKHDGFERRSAQTVCATILDTLTKLMAPIMSFTAEQLSDYYQKNKTESIHLQKFPELTQVWSQLAQRKNISATLYQYRSVGETTAQKVEEIAALHKNEERWEILKDIRSALLKAIEVQREKQLIKHSLEAKVTFHIDSAADYAQNVQALFMNINENNENIQNFFREFLIVSQVVIVTDVDGLHETGLKGLSARVDHADGVKCPRCWQWSVTQDCDGLCDRCKQIVG